MQIDNQLNSQSLQYTIDKPNMLIRSKEIEQLGEIVKYCEDIGETVNYLDDIWNIEVEQDVNFADWVYGTSGAEDYDYKRFFLELVSKQKKQLSNIDQTIMISLGEYESAINDLREYVDTRRDILKGISNPREFCTFMTTCFVNCLFAEDIVREMRDIQNFGNHTDEIVKNLSVLNDEAISLYEQYHDNLKEAMAILSSKLIECSPDPNHADVLKFTFRYDEYVNGERIERNKAVICSPHLKLIHKGSNLRIYFQWCDEEIANGEKVLIGRIGSHPYKKG